MCSIKFMLVRMFEKFTQGLPLATRFVIAYFSSKKERSVIPMSEKCVKSVSVEYLERLKQEMSEAKPKNVPIDKALSGLERYVVKMSDEGHTPDEIAEVMNKEFRIVSKRRVQQIIAKSARKRKEAASRKRSRVKAKSAEAPAADVASEGVRAF